MAVIHFHHQRQQRLARRTKQHWRTNQEPSGLVNGMTLTGIGLALLIGWMAAEVSHANFIGVVLLFFSSPFLVFGGILLLVLAVESVVRHFKRIQSHCGRCQFYRALETGYALGHCQADPRLRIRQRTDACPFFTYSERAMVRDRFAQQAEIEARRRGHSHIQSSV